MREAPIRKMTVPVTIGGNIRFSARGGKNDMNISRKEHINEVPYGLRQEIKILN